MSYYSFIVVLTGPINTNINIKDIFDDNDNVNINPLKFTMNNQTRFSSQQQRNSLFNINFMAYKFLPVIIVLLMIVIGILSGFIAIHPNRIQRLTNEIKMRDDVMLKMENRINLTRQLNEIYKARELRHDLRIFAFKSQISEYQNNVTRLNNELVELEENESKIYIYSF
jgi:hypothetical protein